MKEMAHFKWDKKKKNGGSGDDDDATLIYVYAEFHYTYASEPGRVERIGSGMAFRRALDAWVKYLPAVAF